MNKYLDYFLRFLLFLTIILCVASFATWNKQNVSTSLGLSATLLAYSIIIMIDLAIMCYHHKSKLLYFLLLLMFISFCISIAVVNELNKVKNASEQEKLIAMSNSKLKQMNNAAASLILISSLGILMSKLLVAKFTKVEIHDFEKDLKKKFQPSGPEFAKVI